MGNYCRYFSRLSNSKNEKDGQNTGVTKYDNSIRINPKKETGGNEMVGNVLITKQDESVLLGGEGTEAVDTTSESSRDSSPKVVLLPHQHTLFCERKVIL